MQIITGIGESEHVTSMQHRAIFEMVIGDNSYILNKGELLEPELQSNNALKIRSGMLAHHGCISEVAPNTYDEVAIGNGSQSMKRIDLVVARYTQNAETKVERTEWTVIQGQPVESNPVAPDYIHGNMQDGDLTDDCPVFEVYLDGIQVVEIKKLLNVLNGSLAELNRKLQADNDWSTYSDNGWTLKYRHITANLISVEASRTSTGNNAAVAGDLVMAGIPFNVAFPQSVQCAMDVSGNIVGNGRARFADNNGLYLYTPGYGNPVTYTAFGIVSVK